MQGENLRGGQIPVQVNELRAELNRLKGAPPNRTVGPPDHLTVQGAINVLANDMRQLQEEIGELRARLSPALADTDHLNRPQEGMPVRSRMAAELFDLLILVKQCRESVELTLLQLDL